MGLFADSCTLGDLELMESRLPAPTDLSLSTTSAERVVDGVDLGEGLSIMVSLSEKLGLGVWWWWLD